MYYVTYSSGVLGECSCIKNPDGSTRLFETLDEAKKFIKHKPHLTIKSCSGE